ncbi:hypothetical protein GCM10007964_38630 [Sphaerisporangium melleum]|uniref:Uncharacterized protein n=1 Tax=Sphaerisporangium melleum TaxID=321316 RepID=A0A917VK54_9ACTN|nr:hypothetical protein GCM10007964_38630 [Sphaerisporangium melleum]
MRPWLRRSFAVICAVSLTALCAWPAAATARPDAAHLRAGAAVAFAGGPVVLVGVPGLQWSDLSQDGTPNLWALTGRGASASMSTRAYPRPDRASTCPVAGWLTVSAGRRAGSAAQECALPQAPQARADGSAGVPGWAELSAFNAATSYQAVIGSLGQAVRDAGGSVAAAGPGAALAAADKSGNIQRYADSVAALGELQRYSLVVADVDDLARAWIGGTPASASAPGPDLTPAARAQAAAAADRKVGEILPLLPPGATVLVAGLSDTSAAAHLHVAIATGTADTPGVSPSATAAPGASPPGEGSADAPPSGTGAPGPSTDAPSSGTGTPSRAPLGADATGGGPQGREPYRHGHLTASSTRQDALVAVTDVTTTVLRLLDVPAPEGAVGRPWVQGGPAPTSTSATVTELADADLASRVLVEVRAPFFAVFVAVQLLFYGLAALAMRRRPPGAAKRRPADLGAPPPGPANRPAAAPHQADVDRVDPGSAGKGPDDGTGGWWVPVATQVLAVVSGAIAVSTFLAQLVPWWSLGHPMAALIATIVGFAALLAALAFAGPWRAHPLGPLTVVAGITSLALLADVMTGSRLQVNAVTGYEPVTGGRFYGFGNIAFAVYATGTILALAGVAQALAERGRRVLGLCVCLAYGLLAIFADGWPGWGADFGGVPAFVLGFAVFVLLLAGRRVTLGRLALVAAGGAVLVGLIAVADWLRPSDQRTHLGAFVQQVADGQALPVVGRKIGAMLGTLGNWQLTALSLAALAFLFLVLARPTRWGASALGLAYAQAPALRAGLFGVLTTALAGFLVNDSGIAIPAMALTVAVPLTLAASIRALQRSAPTTSGRSSAPAGSTAPPGRAAR